ncbi:RagB/SusD family nutrient uptake outer membrane protein [Pedobacter gandavensis]|uniref:RagB/SusD family nutrient uptake outer membrane protein n=1 Tax=Pedobacter gandavensis TaxID=2679963 RepID=UPI00247A51DD|nr:RagB/SusD family nutrient uptake outer membrane protein [Pedobacter gandavensis]WGQ09175.1 RagB/SusD family nutrient uptake outer membrane protein [Pedobacter gandavensis]
MKKYIYIVMLFALLFSLGACKKYLNTEHYFKEDRLSLDKVFTNKNYSNQWLADVYTHLRGSNAEVASKGLTPFNFISDDMFYGDRSNTYKTFKNGEYNEGSEQGSWGSCYEGIRDASIFIHNIDRNKEMTANEVADTKAQARFLRAYYYWLLLRKYGPIPILPDEGEDYTKEYQEIARPRSSYDECVEFITAEFALAARDLPLYNTNRDKARASRGAALAARAKVYLFAASPLFNGNPGLVGLVDHEGKKLVSQEYKNEKWAKAAAAAKDVINMNIYRLFTAPFKAADQGPGQPKTIVPPYHPKYSDQSFPMGWKNIDPFESYRQLFNGAISYSDNPELIFSRVTEQSSEGIDQMVLHQMPFSMKGWNTHGITQKQADAYYMNDGSNIATSPRRTGYTTDATGHLPLPAKVSLQYAEREPRFYASVAYNGSIWENISALKPENRHIQIFYYRDHPNGKQASSPDFYIRTGLGIKKFYNPIDSYMEGGFIVPKVEPAMRYADILLVYAEALNELTGTYAIPSYTGAETITVGRDVPEISRYISEVRIRGGVPDYGNEVYGSPDLLRKAIKRERQIELFAEGQRYFDLRRWKDAPVEEATPVMGCNMNMTESQRDLFNTPVPIPSMPTIFVDKMYLWPISHSELRKNRKLTQNPGWTTFN